METFDDFRAEEAFRVLAGMANVGQVIYLTHHEHLCGIPKNVSRTFESISFNLSGVLQNLSEHANVPSTR